MDSAPLFVKPHGRPKRRNAGQRIQKAGAPFPASNIKKGAANRPTSTPFTHLRRKPSMKAPGRNRPANGNAPDRLGPNGVRRITVDDLRKMYQEAQKQQIPLILLLWGETKGRKLLEVAQQIHQSWPGTKFNFLPPRVRPPIAVK